MADPEPTRLLCAPCLSFGEPVDAEESYDGPTAVTVMAGTALCMWHFEYAHSQTTISRWDHRRG